MKAYVKPVVLAAEELSEQQAGKILQLTAGQ